MMRADLLSADFRALSARLGNDPMQVQGPGGNTSVKAGGVMWIKASGTKLADAETQDIFVPVDRNAAKSLAQGNGTTSDEDLVLDASSELRPSIETTFHAALDHAIVVHTHSVATLVHAISPEGLDHLASRLDGLPYVVVPYAKPGLPLTREILARSKPDSRIFILQNHGLICCGQDVAETGTLVATVEKRLSLLARPVNHTRPDRQPHPGYHWSEYSWLARDPRSAALAAQGSYYPDHVVFLGPGLPRRSHTGNPPVILREGVGVLVHNDASPSQKAMLRCLSDILIRLPELWSVVEIGHEAEAVLLDWDAEKYRQELATRQ